MGGEASLKSPSVFINAGIRLWVTHILPSFNLFQNRISPSVQKALVASDAPFLDSSVPSASYLMPCPIVIILESKISFYSGTSVCSVRGMIPQQAPTLKRPSAWKPAFGELIKTVMLIHIPKETPFLLRCEPSWPTALYLLTAPELSKSGLMRTLGWSRTEFKSQVVWAREIQS